MIISMLAPAAVAVAQPALRSAFLCEFDGVVSGKMGDPPQPLKSAKQLAVLMAGPAETVAEDAPLEVWDPDRTLEGQVFRKLALKDPSGDSYAFTTGPAREGATWMMSLTFSNKHGGGVYLAGLGLMGPGRPRYLGRCFALQSTDTKKDFDQFTAEGGFRR